MGTEIERKFLVRKELLPKELPPGDELEQGYLSTDPTVRVRLVATPDGTRHAELTIKGKGMLQRAEFNYPIPPRRRGSPAPPLRPQPAQGAPQARPLGPRPLPRPRSVARRDRAEE